MISLRQIQAIVHQYPAKFHPTRIEPLGAAGGMSGAQFWRAESPAGAFALRRWPSEHPSVECLRFIHKVLAHAAERGISFVPVPIRLSAGESFTLVDGHLWELSAWMPGAADFKRTPSAEKLSAAMAALARFHKAVTDFPATTAAQVTGSAPAVVRRLARLRELTAQDTGGSSQAVNFSIWPELEPLAHRFLATIPKRLPLAISDLEPLSKVSLPTQPCIRDIWHDHMLFTGTEVTGVIDFGALDIDTPATDIARLLGSLVGDDAVGWRTGLAAYSAIRPLSANEERAIKALDAASTILAGCNWLQWICSERREFEDHSRVTERFRQIVTRCEFAIANSPSAPGSAGG